MLPKKNRVGRKDVNLIFQKGRFLSSPNLIFKFTTQGNEKKISFITPKSVSRLAVKRNSLRRRGYAALDKLFSGFPLPITGVFIFKKYPDSIQVLENEIKNLLSKIH